ncbi:PP2C family protein-serine/threonine phosphatase [Rubinisphaera italica]|uniref:Phosphoserine phosphatase RsbU n=1 Tax=Rubinisphaera italica TaxID=2527969 RepID=A0A5C5XG45_9PLAN|nr:PP2C family protein-serine/threonine phosphatase [Rubinisphaera italica]TWT61980.1 Phosphoserine phosphatase RsbU [Rubinisphaera italica]
MSSSGQENVTENWLRNACQRMSGDRMRLEYYPITSESTECSRQLWDGSEVIWQREVHLEPGREGVMRIRIDSAQTADQSVLKLCHFADHLVHLAESPRVLSAPDDSRISSKDVRKYSTKKAADQNADAPLAVNRSIDASLESILKLTNYRGAAFLMLNESGQELRLKSYVHQSLNPLPFPERKLADSNIDRLAMLEGYGVCRGNHTQGRVWLPTDVMTGICVSVRFTTGVIGTVWVFDRRNREVYDRELHVVQSIAAQLGADLEERLRDQQNTDHRRMRTELKLAALTQPARQILFSDRTGSVDAHGCCMSRYDVGGDLCEIFPMSESQFFVAMGDASGNSLPAAMVMTAVRGAIYAMLYQIRAESIEKFQPAEFVGRLNQMLDDLTGAHQFMTFVCGLVDLTTRTFRYCNAGHPQPIHIQTEKVEYLASNGLIMGVDGDAYYSESEINYEAGEALVFYTDGISEALNREHRQFRQDGIVAAAQPRLNHSAKSIFQGIWSGVKSHQMGDSENDDASVLVLKF